MKLEAVPYSLRDDIHIVLRSATQQDADLYLNLLKALSDDTHFAEFEANEISNDVKAYQEYISNIEQSNNSILMLVMHDFEPIGFSSIEPASNAGKQKHRCMIRGGLLMHYMGYGIGRLTLQTTLKLAQKLGYEQCETEVFADNSRMVDMYQHMGFEQWGRIPRAYKTTSDYIDKLIFGKQISKN